MNIVVIFCLIWVCFLPFIIAFMWSTADCLNDDLMHNLKRKKKDE
jgi:hypothetical protein